MKLDASDIGDLQPVITEAVRVAIAEIRDHEGRLPLERLGFCEVEASRLLGIKPHILGDARRRGEITARKIGKKYVYSRAALVRFLEEHA
ncbi:MAG TPA: helix-turn-helix domain-containing protein [Pirellulales bacterium]|jgi:hypothetical protein|nr:helix-turn-helix domain-containing protein [Pirellulales bacterium]